MDESRAILAETNDNCDFRTRSKSVDSDTISTSKLRNKWMILTA